MPMIRSEKGVTMVALALTLMIIALLTVPVMINTTKISDFNRYAKLKGDIDTLNEAISVVYFREPDLSGIGPEYVGNKTFLDTVQGGKEVRDYNDDSIYYVIDYNKLRDAMPTTLKDLSYGEINGWASLPSTQYGDNTYLGRAPSTAQEYNDVRDVYIINNATHQIYYVNGVEYKDVVYYKLADE